MVYARACIRYSPLAFSEIIFPYRKRTRAFVEVPRHKDQEADATEDPEGIGTKKLRTARGNNRGCDATDDDA